MLVEIYIFLKQLEDQINGDVKFSIEIEDECIKITGRWYGGEDNLRVQKKYPLIDIAQVNFNIQHFLTDELIHLCNREYHAYLVDRKTR